MSIYRTIALALLLPILSGCDVDPFNASCRAISASGYDLCQGEDESSYWLVRHGERANGGGVIDGTVISIAWNRRVIAAERQPLFGNEAKGIVILDLNLGRYSGPMSAADAERQYHVGELKPAGTVWHKL